MLILIITVFLYLAVIGYLGYLGYKRTTTTQDYLVAGRKMHPVVMALSYGSTFISTSAIVGFGGAAALFGMGVLWLTALNVAVGIFIAFVVFGGRTRRLGHHLNAHTFPELLGKRFDSKFIQIFSGLVIFFGMPLYAGVVLMGAAKFVEAKLAIPYDPALLLYGIIVFLYVVMGGLKGVMYTDAFQGAIMLIGMTILIVFTYGMLGGVTSAHEQLTALAPEAVKVFGPAGHQGWTAMPATGSQFWWILVSTIIMGVGIGVLAQPQLIVRFMTVKSQREIYRAVPVGGVFILMMTGVAFVVGALSNVYFFNNPEYHAISFIAAGKEVDKIIPLYVTQAMPEWFSAIFMVSLLAAAMSTTSSQFHAMGAAIGRDVYEQIFTNVKNPILVSRIGIFITYVVSMLIAWVLPTIFGATMAAIIASGTAIFFGLCASTFLPAYVGALYSKRITRGGVIAGMLSGFCVSAFWLFFIHAKESAALNVCQALFNKPSLAQFLNDAGKWVSYKSGFILWSDVDPLFVALPISIIVTLIISTVTKPYSDDFLKKAGVIQ
ncbi:MAG: sodium/solute symporter [bacterium]|nr:sodium/solute symporter [bacterium]